MTNRITAHVFPRPAVAVDSSFYEAALAKASEILEQQGLAVFLPPSVGEIEIHVDFDLGLVPHSPHRHDAVIRLAHMIAAELELKIHNAGISIAMKILHRLSESDISQENARSVLNFIQKHDKGWALDQDTSYKLRQYCLWKDKTPDPSSVIQSCQAYTNQGKGPPNEAALQRGAPNEWPEWHPRRVPILNEAYKFVDDGAKTMAERMSHKPIMLVMRGNTASGKTTSLKSVEKLASQIPVLSELTVLDAAKEPTGAFNPDTVKGHLRRNAESMKSTHGQVHEEGSTIVNVAIGEFLKTGKSYVLDKRFGKGTQVSKVIKAARGQQTPDGKGYTVFMIDVDADLGTSCSRVLQSRVETGDDPIVSFGPVMEGFEEVRRDRQSVAEHADVDVYLCFRSELDFAHPKNGTLIASRFGRPGHAPLETRDDSLWKRATSAGHDDVEESSKHFDALMKQYASNPKSVSPQMRLDAINGYRGALHLQPITLDKIKS
jgi:hypothetical protein